MTTNELIFTSLLLVFLPLMVLRMTLKYRERKQRLFGEKAGTDNSLTTSELRAMIEDVVQSNLLGIQDRLDRLEHAVFGEGTVDDPVPLPESDEMEEVSKSMGRADRPRVR